MPEFQRGALESLREPLETGRITISRAARRAEYPARFQLIAAMNPCPCGNLGHPRHACRCSADAVARYQGRLSGPLLDRIDLQVEVPAVAPEVLAAAPGGAGTATVAARVAAARSRQLARQGRLNAALEAARLDEHVHADAQALRVLQTTAARLGWSGRALHRTLRIARTAADLSGSDTVQAAHVAEAVQYRRVLAASPAAA